ncbi:MAG: EAL domain-containing protein [Gemmatimonadaceae bacterium]|nr:EAL domain-containing protein [Gemmatimonadaceae bacterium]
MTVPSELPLSGQTDARDPVLLAGTLAASMEQLARVCVAATGADGAVVALLGADRRSFSAGAVAPSWMAHDSGILIRTGLVAAAIEQGGTLALDTSMGEDRDHGHRVLRELGVGGLLVSVLLRDDGTVLGAVVAVSRASRAWSDDRISALRDLAAIGTSKLTLRLALAEREVREQRLRHDSQHDPLTGLPNRAMFLKRLADASLRARRGVDGIFAVLFLDVDDFKLVNDSMGHHVGDEVLVEIARRLETCIRGGDLVARLGGDEFAILLERVTDARETAIVAERVHEAVRVPMTISGYEWTSTASIGVALSSPGNEAPDYLLRSADMAMYRAKHQGRGRFELYDRGQHAQALTRLQTETELRRAIDREEFELHYQPIVAMGDGRTVGVEALIRWRHAERGLVAPNHFIPVAEETGLIVQIGRWVLRRAISDLARWDRDLAGLAELTMAVNLSAREFAQLDLVKVVADALTESELAPSRLNLEITESTIFSQQNVALDTVSELKALGVQIHIDDFGTGYSSLSYLQRLPVDAIKIDRSFVRAIEVEARSRHVVQSLVSLARGIGLDTIAEGVGSDGQVDLLRGMQCTFGQGFHLGRPVPGREIVQGLLRRAEPVALRRRND